VRTLTSRAEMIAVAGFTLAWLLAIDRAGFWFVIPAWLLWLFGAAWLVATRHAWLEARGRSTWPQGGAQRIRIGVIGALTVTSIALWAAALAGRAPPAAEGIDLTFPLRGGRFVVANGGSNALVNAHVGTLDDPRFAPVRGQAYALDIVAVNAIGVRAFGLLPADPNRYVIFGMPVHAPCAGVVSQTENTLPDLSPPQTDPRNPAGNNVMIDCGGFTLLLAHLRQGSVRVRPGQRLANGDLVGSVGNSGNSDEPHLHVHAQGPGTGALMLGGEPLSMRFDGRLPVRNDRLRSP